VTKEQALRRMEAATAKIVEDIRGLAAAAARVAESDFATVYVANEVGAKLALDPGVVESVIKELALVATKFEGGTDGGKEDRAGRPRAGR
jgi:hypothetical protein